MLLKSSTYLFASRRILLLYRFYQQFACDFCCGFSHQMFFSRDTTISLVFDEADQMRGGFPHLLVSHTTLLARRGTSVCEELKLKQK